MAVAIRARLRRLRFSCGSLSCITASIVPPYEHLSRDARRSNGSGWRRPDDRLSDPYAVSPLLGTPSTQLREKSASGYGLTPEVAPLSLHRLTPSPRLPPPRPS